VPVTYIDDTTALRDAPAARAVASREPVDAWLAGARGKAAAEMLDAYVERGETPESAQRSFDTLADAFEHGGWSDFMAQLRDAEARDVGTRRDPVVRWDDLLVLACEARRAHRAGGRFSPSLQARWRAWLLATDAYLLQHPPRPGRYVDDVSDFAARKLRRAQELFRADHRRRGNIARGAHVVDASASPVPNRYLCDELFVEARGILPSAIGMRRLRTLIGADEFREVFGMEVDTHAAECTDANCQGGCVPASLLRRRCPQGKGALNHIIAKFWFARGSGFPWGEVDPTPRQLACAAIVLGYLSRDVAREVFAEWRKRRKATEKTFTSAKLLEYVTEDARSVVRQTRARAPNMFPRRRLENGSWVWVSADLHSGAA
jgi:hypothetical protein